MISLVREQLVSQSLLMTSSRVWKHSFLKSSLRISFQVCSMGFISGVAGGRKNSWILDGISKWVVVCHDALSQTKRMMSSGKAFERSRKNKVMQTVLLYGRIKKKFSPVNGSTAPYAYRYSRIWWHGTDGRSPLRHQQYLGLLIRPKPASSSNINRTRPVERVLKVLLNFRISALIFLRRHTPPRLPCSDAGFAA